MAEQHGGGEDIGATIIHHVSNSDVIVPINLGGVDLSITKHVVVLWVVSLIVLIAFTWVAGRMKRSEDGAPRGRLVVMLESFVSFIREQMVIPFIGEKHAAKFTPLLLTMFMFILTSNLLGLTPLIDLAAKAAGFTTLEHGSSTPTGNFNVTAGLAVITFGAIIFAGSVAHGVIGHWKNLVPHGLPLPVYVILVPIEIIGMFVKPFALTMRLAANMTAGHAAIIAIMSLIFVFKTAWMGIVSVPLMVGLSLLEIIVCFVQAYVFTLLSSLFIGMAIHVHH